MSPAQPNRRQPRLRCVAGVLRMLRAMLYAVPLAWVLGGGCSFAYSTGHHDDHNHNDDGTTVVVQNATSDSGGGSGDGGVAGTEALDPELFRLSECFIQFATREEVAAYRAEGGQAPLPLFQRVTAREPNVVIPGVSPTRLWQPEQIGDRELAAFAAGVLRVNEAELHLPLPASELQYLDTQVTDGVASVRFARRAAVEGVAAGTLPAATPAAVMSVNFGQTGELVSIERLAGDRTPLLR